ncbi:MAG: hypothetical protein ABIP75_08945 [Pyrinomonadaceae bacterium]
MSESRHNTNLIVTVLSACVALMCGMPAYGPLPKAEDFGNATSLSEFPDGVESSFHFGEETQTGTEKISRVDSSSNRSADRFQDLSAAIAELYSAQTPALPRPAFEPIREQTDSLASDHQFLSITNLPRAGII